MKSMSTWLNEYGESHQNRINKIIHYICVPAIYMTVFGLLWTLPFPFSDLPKWLNWSTVIALPVMIFYFMLSAKVGIGMTLFSAVVVAFLNWWEINMSMSVINMSIIVFIISWVLQFVGHYLEGKKPSFFKDLQFLLIGPAWILCFVFKKADINY